MLPSDRQDTFLAARTDRQTPAGLASYGLHPMCRIAACGRPDPSQPCMHALSRACSLTRCTSHKLYVPTCTFWLSSLLCTAARNLCPEFKDDERDRKLAILVVARQRSSSITYQGTVARSSNNLARPSKDCKPSKSFHFPQCL